MSAEVPLACKYESFNTLIKINDPELLLEVFLSQLTPEYGSNIQVEMYEHKASVWKQNMSNGHFSSDFDKDKQSILDQKIDPDKTNTWFYQPSLNGWFCVYKPLSNKQYAMFFSVNNAENIIDEDYIQLLFGFYCHQLCSLEGTYRDNQTGLYNRKAFDFRIESLLHKHDIVRRNNQCSPSFFVMLDIDNFKDINDSYGHLYGDEVLTIISKLMNDSFREYDLLFRYGGEEFSVVLMDIDNDICNQVLNRFRMKVESYDYPKLDKVTISLGYTDFNRKLSVDQLIEQADRALYYSKENGRNTTHQYQDLIKQELIANV